MDLGAKARKCDEPLCTVSFFDVLISVSNYSDLGGYNDDVMLFYEIVKCWSSNTQEFSCR